MEKKEKKMPQTTKKQIRIRIVSYNAIVLVVISLLWSILNIYYYLRIRNDVSMIDKLGMIAAIGIFFAALIHPFSFLSLITIIKHEKKLFKLSILAIILGLASFIGTFVDFAALSDIGNEYPAGYACRMEWMSIFLSSISHILYYLVFILCVMKFLSRYMQSNLKTFFNNEEYFLATNLLGLNTGLIGLTFTLCITIIFPHPPTWWKYVVLPFWVMMLFPYGMMLFLWVVNKKARQLLDEKQRIDIYRAGYLTWLLSIPALLIIFLFDKIYLITFWFQLILFFSLIIFSVTTLVYFRK